MRHKSGKAAMPRDFGSPWAEGPSKSALSDYDIPAAATPKLPDISTQLHWPMACPT